MANFSLLKSKSLNQIEKENSEFIVELPLHMSEDAFIGEGSFAKVYKFSHKKKVVACKLYKHQFPKSKMFYMSNRFKNKYINILVQGTLSKIVIKLSDFCDLAIMKETMATKTKVKAGFAGLTIAYLSPEICNRTVNIVTKESDVYAMSLSFFEIMSGLDSPLQNHFSIYKDIFLTQALEKGERPDTSLIYKIYLESDTRHLVETIVGGWCNDPELRLTCVQIIGRLKEIVTSMSLKDSSNEEVFEMLKEPLFK
ncbi:uncharacterized protein LOC124809409 [Hydra vulgaris]|uniref:uncharacterized protein LOC124809409 n=1 Tax=Hydra vulgaris TaxID=6087 RepID=UPI0032EA3C2E